jgi:hypothetical protein
LYYVTNHVELLVCGIHNALFHEARHAMREDPPLAGMKRMDVSHKLGEPVILLFFAAPIPWSSFYEDYTHCPKIR